MRELSPDYTFLSRIGLDHVADMLEIHLQAVYLGMEQIRVQATDVIPNHPLFLQLIDRYRVCGSFAPKFFLARLRLTLEAEQKGPTQFGLSCLRCITSGEEAVEISYALSKILSAYGAPSNVLAPGFGMTEICAGSIFNRNCPQSDVERGLEVTALGSCIPGIQMRITVQSENGRIAQSNERGDLELTGPIVFKEYSHHAVATKKLFTADGWFKTGDKALIDSNGMLKLTGYATEQININGVKYSPHEIEDALEENLMPGATQSYTTCFSYLLRGSQT